MVERLPQEGIVDGGICDVAGGIYVEQIYKARLDILN